MTTKKYVGMEAITELANIIENKFSTLQAEVNAKADASDLNSHISNKSNPHNVTLSQLGVTATAAELNKLDGVTATTTELNYIDGVTSNIQTQLNNKAASSHTHNVLSVQSDNYKQGTDLPSTYPRGETIFFSNNPTNKFNGMSYCTVHTIKGYGNMVCIQYVYPYNTNADTIYYRTALYNTDVWREWKTISTSEHTHSYAGSSSVGGSATSAVKLDSSAGSTTQPIYFSSGKPVATTYALNKTVPANAIFTDTTYSAGTGISLSGTTFNHSNSITAGSANEGGSTRTLAFGGTFNIPSVNYDAQGHITGKGSVTLTMPANPNTDTKNTAGSSNSSSKLFLIGATSQAANPQTYSHDTAYVGTDGHLYSNSKQVVNLSDTQALTNKTYNGYTLAAACAKGVTDSSSAGAIGTGTNLVTERDVYYGLPKINNSHSYTSSTSIYAPTAGGTANYVLIGAGTTSAPTWTAQSNLSVGTAASCTGNAATATKLASAKSIGLGTGATGTATNFDGSGNITIPVTDVKESYLSWGGKALSGGVSPIDAACSNVHSANRFAFAKPAGITIEYSTNGSTYSTYSTTDSAKINLVSGIGSAYYIGARSTSTTVNDKLRITLNATNMGVYTRLRKLLINISTNYATGSNVIIEKSMKGSETTYTTVGTYNISGWSGWNSIPISAAFGGGDTQTYNIANIRLTFGITGVNSSQTSNALTITDIIGIGDTYWSFPSTMAKTGHVYTYDSSQNTTFPAKVTATTFVGALSGNATTATTATKLGSTTIGSATQPIYLNNGTATACTYTLGKSVPSNAVFTDTNTKVTNTLATTTKAYVTGTTSASTNTGTQVFDTGVYLDTTAGKLTATTFNGTTFSGGGVATVSEVEAYLGI